jgi:hypothetical protein
VLPPADHQQAIHCAAASVDAAVSASDLAGAVADRRHSAAGASADIDHTTSRINQRGWPIAHS